MLSGPLSSPKVCGEGIRTHLAWVKKWLKKLHNLLTTISIENRPGSIRSLMLIISKNGATVPFVPLPSRPRWRMKEFEGPLSSEWTGIQRFFSSFFFSVRWFYFLLFDNNLMCECIGHVIASFFFSFHFVIFKTNCIFLSKCTGDKMFTTKNFLSSLRLALLPWV